MKNGGEMGRFPSRKNPRLKHFDYTTPNYYFVTICTWEKRYLFWDSEGLNSFGKIARQELVNIPSHFPNVRVDQYVVMPNHVHAILILDGCETNLSTIIGLYKSGVTKQIHGIAPECRLWHSSFHDHVIRNRKEYERIWLYIEANPAKWNDDCFFCG